MHVIHRYRDATKNLRTHFLRIIAKAKVKPYPKPLQNLRSSREIELCEIYPEHVVALWIGHGQDTARKHYLAPLDERFEHVAGVGVDAGPDSGDMPTPVVHNVGQHKSALPRIARRYVARQAASPEQLAGVGVSERSEYPREDSNL